MSYWRRKGFFYVCELTAVETRQRRRFTLTLSLDFISYHLIRLIHGEQELSDMVDRAILTHKENL